MITRIDNIAQEVVATVGSNSLSAVMPTSSTGTAPAPQNTLPLANDGTVGSTYTGKQIINDNLMQLADSFRHVDIAAQKTSENVQKMQGQLAAIKKMFPPYPLQDQERIAYLEGYKALRDQLSQGFIPKDSIAAKLVGDPSQIPGAGDVQVKVGGNGTEVTIPSKPLFPGEGGLDIPNLDPKQSSNGQVDQALGSLYKADIKIQEQRAHLAGSAAQVVGAIHQEGPEAKVHEPDAQKISLEIKHVFTKLPGVGVTKAKEPLLHMLA